jgi:hypothetical protein
VDYRVSVRSSRDRCRLAMIVAPLFSVTCMRDPSYGVHDAT